MDLGIAGKHAIVCAASKGLGRACAFALAREGVNVVICARRVDPLQQTDDEIRQGTRVDVVAIAADITTPAGREQVLAACPNPDILVNNAGGPPPGDFRDWTRDDWIKALDANMLTAIELIKATVDGMIDRRFGRIVNITAAAVPLAAGTFPSQIRSGASWRGEQQSCLRSLGPTLRGFVWQPSDTIVRALLSACGMAAVIPMAEGLRGEEEFLHLIEAHECEIADPTRRYS